MSKFIVYKIIVKKRHVDDAITFAFDSEKERNKSFDEITNKLMKIDNESRIFFLWGNVLFNVFDISTVMKQEETLAGEKQDE